jgi:ArsR family transcriptional regulator
MRIYSCKEDRMSDLLLPASEVSKERDLQACSCSLLHEENISRAAAGLPSPAAIEGLGDLFKVFADPSRLRILAALSSAELCVCDLESLLGMSQSAVSHQLALLRRARLVRTRRQGRVLWYSLDDSHVDKILAIGMAHATEGRRA